MPTTLSGGLTTGMSFAIYGSTSEFGPEGGKRQLTPTALKPKYEARAIYELLKEAGCRIYPVAPDVRRIGDDTVYGGLADLPAPVDVLIMSLGKDQSLAAAREAHAAGIRHIWFQFRTYSKETLKFCSENDIHVIRGCAMKHRTVCGPARLLSPCFWMGLRSAKLGSGAREG